MEDYNDDTNTKLKTPIKIKENFTRIRKISSGNITKLSLPFH